MISFVTLNILSFLSGSIGLYNTTSASSLFAFLGVMLSAAYLAGACLVNAFRSTNDDEGSIKYTRGYRSGVKFLNVASMLDVLHGALLLILYFSQLIYLDDAWQAEAVKPNPVVVYCTFARILHAAALIFFAAAFFFMEAFHSIGTAELWGWGIASVLKIAATTQIIALITDWRLVEFVAVIANGLALMATFLWAASFEQLVLSKEVAMDQSALRNEWFKSRNAMAYYGPPIEEGTHMVNDSPSPAVDIPSRSKRLQNSMI